MKEKIEGINEILYNLTDQFCVIEDKDFQHSIYTLDFAVKEKYLKSEHLEELGIELADSISKIKGVVGANVNEIKFTLQIQLPNN
jgi:hypothetical protein